MEIKNIILGKKEVQVFAEKEFGGYMFKIFPE